MGTTVLQIRIELIFCQCGNSITPSRSFMDRIDSEATDRAIQVSRPGPETDADRTSLAPDDFALSAHDGFWHDREPETASDRSFDVRDELRPICGHVQDLAFVTLNVVLYRDPRQMVPGSAR